MLIELAGWYEYLAWTARQCDDAARAPDRRAHTRVRCVGIEPASLGLGCVA
jgi:hypothetical protein